MLNYITRTVFGVLMIFISSCSTDENKPEEETLITYNLTTNVLPEDSGSISTSADEYEKGEEVSLEAIPVEGFIFKEWEGGVEGQDNPVKFIMDSDKTIIAVFEKVTYSLGIDILGKWSITTSRSQEKTSTTNECTLISIEFQADGVFIIITSEGEIRGTYTISGNNSIDLGIGTITNLDLSEEGVLSFVINLEGSCSSELSGQLLTYVPDDVLEQELINQGYDDILDDYVLPENIRNVTTLRIVTPPKEITDFTGLEDFTNLENLVVYIHNFSSEYNETRPEIKFNLTSNNKLKSLDLDGVHLKNLNLDNNPLLEKVFLYYTGLAGDVSFRNNPLLREVSISANWVIIDNAIQNIDLDFRQNPNLEYFSSDDTSIGRIDISKSPNMKILSINESVGELIMSGIYDKMTRLHITGSSPYHYSINLNNIPNLEIINLFYEQPLSFTNYSGLKELSLSYNQATTLDLSQNTELYSLSLGMSKLTSLQLTNNQNLTYLGITAPLSNLDINNNTELLSISLGITNIRSFDISNSPNLEMLNAKYSQLECVQVSDEQKKNIENGQFSSWDIGEANFSLNCN